MPSVILANVGTPLIWATLFHMTLGNACIGVLEGALLASLYRVSAGRAISLMILANYFSAWVGWSYLHLLVDRNDISLDNAASVLAGMVAVAYAMTCLLEWPFVAGCFWRAEKPLRRSVTASMLVQSVSYVLLIGWYGLASVYSLCTDLTIVPPDQIALPHDVCIYSIADEDGNVYSRELGTGRQRQVYELKSRDFKDCLSFQASESEAGFHKIVALLESGDRNEPKVVDLDIAVHDENCPLSENGRPLMADRFHSPIAPKLGSAYDSPWTINAGFWAAQGLAGENSKTGEQFRFAIEVPFIQWNVRHAILLPGEQVLFQLGTRQVCILDLKARKVAVLCFGHGAVAVLDRETKESTVQAVGARNVLISTD